MSKDKKIMEAISMVSDAYYEGNTSIPSLIRAVEPIFKMAISQRKRRELIHYEIAIFSEGLVKRWTYDLDKLKDKS